MTAHSTASLTDTSSDKPSPLKAGARRFSTAPMMDWSDRHCRRFWRTLTRHSLLYSEMVTTGALIHGDRQRFLQYSDEEHPIALQLGGSDPQQLAQCAAFAQQFGYDEVNLNVGCPSDRVQNNMIGACLMAHPELVRDGLQAMRDACGIDVTVKHRIGIDDQDSYEHLRDFVGIVKDSGVTTFIVHARTAILQGLSPKENREVPPLRYELVYRLKQEFPELEIILNGGIETHAACETHLGHLDGVMLGREAYHNPSVLMAADHLYFGEPAPPDTSIEARKHAIRSLYPYIEQELSRGAVLHHISRHMLGLFNGAKGARLFRRHLSEQAHKRTSGVDVMEQALEFVQPAVFAEAAH
ncbi:tRNA dihydrouridine(20/20a) synthase DusA [Bacterioplanes sanyensis]|uniref:tRNA-dihydrouridine(20/20a) synthase n=1 Tax=Bacterioplanes sanyensis TaxID=1249553 RepID=A0A222FM68_9GAMM|nr:tRNA dihydrouridine(20/20a) synthase DusA [Bacterioplanes sanyensis]ASP39762.1 tRNA dihydrouridine(20/20a) synthase DusA [Bacterioplanes sanyensis]